MHRLLKHLYNSEAKYLPDSTTQNLNPDDYLLVTQDLLFYIQTRTIISMYNVKKNLVLLSTFS